MKISIGFDRSLYKKILKLAERVIVPQIIAVERIMPIMVTMVRFRFSFRLRKVRVFKIFTAGSPHL